MSPINRSSAMKTSRDEWISSYKNGFNRLRSNIEKHQDINIKTKEVVILGIIGAAVINILTDAIFTYLLDGNNYTLRYYHHGFSAFTRGSNLVYKYTFI